MLVITAYVLDSGYLISRGGYPGIYIVIGSNIRGNCPKGGNVQLEMSGYLCMGVGGLMSLGVSMAGRMDTFIYSWSDS